MKPKGKIEQK